MPVVVMNPAIQHGCSLRRVLVRDAIRPFTQRRLNEAFGFSVGLRSIGSSEGMPQAESTARTSKWLGAKGGAIVGEYTTYADAELSEILHRSLQKRGRATHAFVALQLRK